MNSKRYKDLRDFKSQEIKRSLVHRARLRKNYFKLVDKHKPEIPTNEAPKPKPDYLQRSNLIKQRKEQKRQEILENIQIKKQRIEKVNRQRERLAKKLERRTKSGQPLMGPRVTKLLDKIKSNNDNPKS